MINGKTPRHDWPLDVIIDLVAHMRRSDMPRTAELLEDAALTFVEEDTTPMLERSNHPSGAEKSLPPPALKLVVGRSD